MNEFVKALWPGGESAVEIIPPAARLDTLRGRQVAFLWDSMFRGDEIFPMLAARLEADFPGVEFVGYDEFGSTFGGDEHAVLEGLPERVKTLQIDAVISGIGA